MKAMLKIGKGEIDSFQIATFLSVYMMRTITSIELAGFRDALLKLCISVDLSDFDPIDLCGTGGDNKNTFNVSTISSFVAAGAGLQFTFGLGAISGPFLCSIFMDLAGSNGFFVFLFIFHSLIGVFGIYRMRVRETVDNPDSQFVAMPQTITPAGIELNPTTEPIEEPIKEENK